LRTNLSAEPSLEAVAARVGDERIHLFAFDFGFGWLTRQTTLTLTLEYGFGLGERVGLRDQTPQNPDGVPVLAESVRHHLSILLGGAYGL
jgi:hypothetical protein